MGWGALTGALIAGYTVIDGFAVKVLLISPIFVDYFGNLLRLPFMLPGCWRDRAGWAEALDAFTATSGGRLDVLFNNAGVPLGGPLASTM